jgi:plasmid stability protein
MSPGVQLNIKDVDPEVYRRLRIRAAERGLSVSAYVREQLARISKPGGCEPPGGKTEEDISHARD